MSQLDDLNRIVASLSEAALDDTRWPATSALIDNTCRVKGNHFMCAQGHNHDDIQIHFSRLYYRGHRREELEREYFDIYYPFDERPPRIRRLPDGKVVHVRDLYSEQELRASPTYNEALPRGDYQNSLNVRLNGPSDTRISFVVANPVNGSDWSSAQVEMIMRILPHLRQYVGFRQALVDAEALGTSLTGLLDNSKSGVIQLDWRGQIVATNDAAQDILRRGDGLSDQSGILRAWSPSDDADLQELLGRALPSFGDQGVSGSMTVRRPSILPRLALQISPVGSSQQDFRPLRVAAIVLVVDPARRTRIDPELVAEALGLTPAESQVAVVLAEGKTVQEIAAATGRKESTIRWHMHHICSKHGISRQVELVQLVLSLGGIPRTRN